MSIPGPHRKLFKTFEQRRTGFLKKLHEIATYLKSVKAEEKNKVELLDDLETKSVMNVIVPGSRIRMIKACSYDRSVPARRAREKRARIKKAKEEAEAAARRAEAAAAAGTTEEIDVKAETIIQ